MDASYLCPAVTFFHEDGTLDLSSQGRLFDSLIANGIDGILVEGSASEFYALNMENRRKIARFAIERVAHRVRLIICTSNLVFQDIIQFSNECLSWGADAVMILPPYYFSFNEENLYRYYTELAHQIHGPIYIYNFPDNTGCEVSAELVLRLATENPNIVGLKDTIPGMAHTREVINVVKSRIPSFEVYSGYDDNFVHNIMAGGDGCIASLSNIVPESCHEWVEAFRQENLQKIVEGQHRVNRLMRIYNIGDLFIAAVKEAAKIRGIAESNACSFPIPSLTETESEQLRQLLYSEGYSKL